MYVIWIVLHPSKLGSDVGMTQCSIRPGGQLPHFIPYIVLQFGHCKLPSC